MIARLTAASLDLDPVDRLREASENVWYVLEDIGPASDYFAELDHHLKVTPVHEAGHAVAMALSGRKVGSVQFSPWGGRRRLGIVKPAVTYTTDEELIEGIGPHGLAREVVTCFAGPLAELRYEPSRAFSGQKSDKTNAENICKLAEFEGLGDSFAWHEEAWRETCRMFSDERVWAATIEIADRLKASTALKVRMAGGVVHRTVDRHLPDGWDWTGIFA